jgi:glucose/arabinose dehydrogenase
MKQAIAALALAGWAYLAPVQAATPETQEYRSEAGTVRVTQVATGLDHPWAVGFLPDGSFIITERPGTVRIVKPGAPPSRPLAGVPKVYARGQAGLMDLALSPDFARDRLVYLSYSEPDAGGARAGSAVGRGRLSADTTRLEDFKVIFRQEPKEGSGVNVGTRIAFDRQGHLFVTLGDNYTQRMAAQDLGQFPGKLLRLNADGSVPRDNPFVARSGALAQIWSYGHRNAEGLALNPWTGAMWESEHGPRGGDEVNIPRAGKNYGWPIATWGIDYSGRPIPEAKGGEAPGTEQPIYWWKVSPALSGMAFYDASRMPRWQHSLFIGALAGQALIRLSVDGDKITHEERLLQQRKERVRDVRQGPDGFVYVLTDEDDGKLLRLELQP